MLSKGGGPQDDRAKTNLFNTGLKSTSLVVERAQDGVYKERKAGSLTAEAKKDAQALKTLEAVTKAKVERLERQAKELMREPGPDGEERLPEDSSEERRRKAAQDELSAGGADEF